MSPASLTLHAMTDNTDKPPTERQRKRREKILQTTREQLAKHGYDGVNMRDLAKAAGVATNTLYNLYESKDKLILKADEEFIGDAEDSVDFDNQTALENFIAFHSAVAKGLEGSPNYAETISKILINAAPESKFVQHTFKPVVDIEKRLLSQLIDEGLLDNQTDLDLASRRLMGATWSCFLLWLKGFIAANDFERTFLEEQLYLLIPLAADQKAKEILENAIS